MSGPVRAAAPGAAGVPARRARLVRGRGAAPAPRGAPASPGEELSASRRRHEELERGAAAEEARLAELRALVEDTDGLEPGREDELRAERERLRHLTELVEGRGSAANALDPGRRRGRCRPGRGGGAVARAGRAGSRPSCRRRRRSYATPSSAARGGRALRSFLASLEAEPGRLEHVEAELDRIADAKRRFRCQTYEELLARAAAARAELGDADGGIDPRQAAAEALAEAERRVERVAGELRAAREQAAGPFAEAVAAELKGIGMGEGEFRVELSERDPGRPAPTRSPS